MWGTLSVIAIAPVLYKDLGYDPKALVPVGADRRVPERAGDPDEPAGQTRMAEFIAYAKANRGKLNFGGSLGTPPQLMGTTFNKVADLGMTYVPYRGGAPSLADLITGRLHMQFDALTLLEPLVKEGKLRALAVRRRQRWPDLPDVPTLREAGLRRFPRQSLGRDHGAAEHAAADRRQAQHHRERHPALAGSQGEPGQA